MGHFFSNLLAHKETTRMHNCTAFDNHPIVAKLTYAEMMRLFQTILEHCVMAASLGFLVGYVVVHFQLGLLVKLQTR